MTKIKKGNNLISKDLVEKASMLPRYEITVRGSTSKIVLLVTAIDKDKKTIFGRTHKDGADKTYHYHSIKKL